jgi:hypothetical protein
MPTTVRNTDILFDNGTIQASASNYIQHVYTGPATWDKPAGLKAVRVTVVGGGSGGMGGLNLGETLSIGGAHGVGGGVSRSVVSAPSIPGPVSVTVGAGGAGGPAPGSPGYSPSGAGGTSSFGTFASATGGGARTATFTPPVGSNFTIAPFSAGVGSGGFQNEWGHASQLYGRGPANPTLTGGNPFNIHGGAITPGANTPGVSATANSGAGGSGASSSGPSSVSRAGGAGGSGIIIVEEFY